MCQIEFKPFLHLTKKPNKKRQIMFPYKNFPILLLCLSSNIININSGGNNKKSSGWHVTQLKPNFDPELPQFTPFNSDEFVRINNSDDESDVIENEPFVNNGNVYRNNSADENHSKLYQHFPASSASSSAEIISKDVADLQERLKPLKNLFMGFYQNYKSSYVGGNNKTMIAPPTASSIPSTQIEDVENRIEDEVDKRPKVNKVKKKKSSKKPSPTKLPEIITADEIKYNVGPGVNLSLDSDKELVNVYLDEDCLKDVFTGKRYLYFFSF